MTEINETDWRHITEEMDRTLRNINYVCTLVDNYGLKNNQDYLNWLDKLNEISVRD